MKLTLTPAQMRTTERNYLRASGLPSLELMERAATALTEILIEKLGGAAGRTVVFACGGGGNGGDGYAAARLFAQRGGRSIVLAAGEIVSDDARANQTRAAQAVYSVAPLDAAATLPRPDAWVDAIFGIGLNRPVSDEIRALISRMERDREAGALVLAADIPSGLSAETGETLGACVHADITVSFHAAKCGHFLAAGPDVTGELRIASIGIPDEFTPLDAARLMEPGDILPHMRPRLRAAHKNTFGHLLLLAGSRGMAGAAILAAKAALAGGAGLVTVAAPESCLIPLQTDAPCAMCLPLPEENGAVAAAALPLLEQTLPGKTAVAAGPGLTTRVPESVLALLMDAGLPAVFDADAINRIAQSDTLHTHLTADHVLTPHPGEAARLLGHRSEAPIADAQEIARMGCQVLLKGPTSVISGVHTSLSPTGTVGMAKGGSGDALTGLLGAFLAQGYASETAAWLASEIHGLAGEAAAADMGIIAMSPLDLIAHLGQVFQQYA